MSCHSERSEKSKRTTSSTRSAAALHNMTMERSFPPASKSPPTVSQSSPNGWRVDHTNKRVVQTKSRSQVPPLPNPGMEHRPPIQDRLCFPPVIEEHGKRRGVPEKPQLSSDHTLADGDRDYRSRRFTRLRKKAGTSRSCSVSVSSNSSRPMGITEGLSSSSRVGGAAVLRMLA